VLHAVAPSANRNTACAWIYTCKVVTGTRNCPEAPTLFRPEASTLLGNQIGVPLLSVAPLLVRLPTCRDRVRAVTRSQSSKHNKQHPSHVANLPSTTNNIRFSFSLQHVRTVETDVAEPTAWKSTAWKNFCLEVCAKQKQSGLKPHHMLI
jgi:hypothetical protein